MAQTIAEQLKELSQIKKDLENAINGLGGEQITSNTPFKQYSSKIKVPSKPGDNTLVITNVSGGGSTEINKISGLSWGQFNENETIEIVATPFNQYVFDRWECISNNYHLEDPTKLSQTIIVGNENLEFRAYFNFDSNSEITYDVIYNIEQWTEANKLIYTNIVKYENLKEGNRIPRFEEPSDMNTKGYSKTITLKQPTIIETKWEYNVVYRQQHVPEITGFYYTGINIPQKEDFVPIYDYKIQLGRDVLGMLTYVFTADNHNVSVDYISEGFPSGYDMPVSEKLSIDIITYFQEKGFGELHFYSEGSTPNTDSSTITIAKKSK